LQIFVGRSTAMTVVVDIVLVLLLATLVFSVVAVVLRLRHRARDRRRDEFASRWGEPLLAALSEPGTVAALRSQVLAEEQLHFVGFAVQYGRRLRGEERNALRNLVLPYLEHVARRAEARSVEVRARAIQTLGMFGLPEHAPRVVAALDDDSDLVAMVAARSLAQRETPDYAAAVMQRLGRFHGWDRRFLASMLAQMGTSVSSTLREGLRDPAVESRSRAVLAEALAIQGDLLAGDIAAEVLASGADSELRFAALRLLHAVGRPEHASVARLHTGEGDETLRAQALRTLGAVGGEADVPVLLQAMSDPSPWVALEAARATLEAGARQALVDIAGSDRGTADLARQVLSEAGAAA
jgi:HEAT repeat protein